MNFYFSKVEWLPKKSYKYLKKIEWLSKKLNEYLKKWNDYEESWTVTVSTNVE